MNRKESQSRNFAIMRLRSMDSLRNLNIMKIIQNSITYQDVFNLDEKEQIRNLVDHALSRLGAETQTNRIKREKGLLKERIEFLR